MNQTFRIGKIEVAANQRTTIDLPITGLFDNTPMTLTVRVINGAEPGARLFLSGAIHGDEINGVEIINRVLSLPELSGLTGTLVAVPIVNVFGFVSESRYLPDRRDLNRSFPGSARGSLAARLAHLFMTEIVERCTCGVDLHTGAIHRDNYPQIRANLDDPETERLATAFGAEVVINAGFRDGSLRQAAGSRNVPVIVYEAGEALRFDEAAIEVGVCGVVNVMRHLGMLPPAEPVAPRHDLIMARSSRWIRAPASGILRYPAALGSQVAKGGRLGVVANPFGENESEVLARNDGLVVGCSNLPLVHEGDALFHMVAREGTQCTALSLEAGMIEEDYEPATPPASG